VVCSSAAKLSKRGAERASCTQKQIQLCGLIVYWFRQRKECSGDTMGAFLKNGGKLDG
jgi:hypothetical protein